MIKDLYDNIINEMVDNHLIAKKDKSYYYELQVYRESGVNTTLPHNANAQYNATINYYLSNSTTTGAIAFRGRRDNGEIRHCAVRINTGYGNFIHAQELGQVVGYTASQFEWYHSPSSWLFS